MKTHLQRLIALLIIATMLLAACGPTAAPEPTKEVVAPTEPSSSAQRPLRRCPQRAKSYRARK